VDVAMLDARLGAERGQVVARPLSAARRWSLRRGPRGAVVERELGVRLDLDGVAKGWLADRALRLTTARSAVVDADGDIAVRVAAGDEWAIGIADPRDPVDPSARLATLRLTAERTRREFGVATSGTSVHRWGVTPGEAAHHLIDPATWQPAATDLVQATVLADSARRAEAFAKAAIIAGSRAAFELADRPFVHGLLVLTERGDVLASPGLVRWLA
jgi:thiamine biosynthesis lipoprotein